MFRAVNDADFVQRCRDLAPVLRAGADEAEARRRLPPSVSAAIHDADILRGLTPTSLGGHGIGLRSFCEGTRELATGCPASAWTVSFLVLHAWLLSRFPPGCHDDLFDAGHVPTAAAPLAPTGRLEVVADGYRVHGRWEWATAISESDWCIVHGFDEGVELGTRFAVLPVADVTVEDTWHTSGMRATGSHTVAVDGAFVPAERTCSGDVLRTAVRPEGDRLGGLPLIPVLALAASASAVGAADAAVEAFRERLAGRVLAYSLGDRAADQPVMLARLAAVTDQRDVALAGWRHAIDRLEVAAADDDVDDLLRARTRLAAASAVRTARLVIGDVGEGAGASVYLSDHPIQRLQRDVETLKGHAVFDWDRTTELAGRVMMGQPLGPTDMA